MRRMDVRNTANLPSDGLIVRQLYADAAERFLVHFSAPFATTQRRAVFSRRRADKKYRRLGPKLRGDSWEEIVLAGRNLYVLEMHTNRKGRITPSILKVDLVTGKSQKIAVELDCKPMKIFGTSEDGRWLYFLSGPWVNRTGAIPVGDYFFARLSLRGKKFERLEQLVGNL